MNISSLDAGLDFPMGKGSSSRVVSPEVGADRITLNRSLFEAGDEFPQHIHDESEDCFIVLSGSVSLRQGETYTRLGPRDFVWVPVGEVHGTVNTSDATAELFSFQSPPDLALYRGDRDGGTSPVHDGISNSRYGAMGEQPVVTQDSGATVRSVASAGQGARQLTVEYVELAPGGSIDILADGEEHVIVVIEGDAAWSVGDQPLANRAVLFGTVDVPSRVRAGDHGAVLVHSRSQTGAHRVGNQ